MKTEVLIIGAGVTGLSCALHLKQLGIKQVTIAQAPEAPPASLLAAGYAGGGQFDNFTRVSHAHGADFAQSLWSFGDKAFDDLQTFCHTAGVPFTARKRLRFITSEQELVEARLAVAQLAAAGFHTTLNERPQSSHETHVSERVLAIQDDGPRGATVNVPSLMASLAAATPYRRVASVERLELSSGGIKAHLNDGETITCELAVAAAHLAIAKLLPHMKDALVSVADQWSTLHVEAQDATYEPWWQGAGVYFSANHTYEWGLSLGQGKLLVGGGRYLRPWAGIEAQSASVEEHITKHLIEQLRKTFKIKDTVRLETSAAALDCKPCDELPLIGPLFGEPRILLATGYMSQGLTQGFLAGRCLAELIANGQADDLPRRLWPERLRSLAS